MFECFWELQMLIFVFDRATARVSVFSAAMETDGEQKQQGASTNGSTASGTSSRPSQMNSMSLYERQAVQVGVCSYGFDQFGCWDPWVGGGGALQPHPGWTETIKSFLKNLKDLLQKDSFPATF